ncbi:aldehyde dehydrogenase [Streptomyces sioyaensis]|uniref:aldehyde dehydrogenase n=1 Tax=Streptomyces sioyaensis TaxID=67364 RepID=UPI003D73DF40
MSESLMYRREFHIGGRWFEPSGSEVLTVISPSSEEPVGEVPLATTQDIDAAVAAARTAFDEGPWPRLSPQERAEVLVRAAELLKARTPEIVQVLIEEMGVASNQAPLQVGTVAPVFEYYADLIRTFAFDRVVRKGDLTGLVVSEPVGVVGAIVPWNAPVTLSAWKVAPALAAGCTVVLKPPPDAPLSTYLLAEALQEAGLPAGVFNLVPGDRDAGEHLVTHLGVDKIAFTGSTAAGRRIMSLCGEQIKRVSLELGGKSAALVLDDADLETTVANLVRGSMHNSGQVCAAITRILVPRASYTQALEIAADQARSIPVGDPHDPATVVGPLVAERQRTRVESYINLAKTEGFRVVAGGGRPSHLPKGWYVEPTILGDVENHMRVAQEEIFGPVVSLIPHDGDDDAVRIANDSLYGLSGSVWSGDDARGLRAARRLRTGGTVVNGGIPPQPLVPFGGFKESGLGRELGVEGLHQYLEPHTIGVPAALVPEGSDS